MLPIRIVILALVLLAGSAMAQKGPVTIGSKIDVEGSILGQIIRLVLEQDGFEVNDRTSFGTTSVVREALLAGEIDLYPEYTGSALTFFEDAVPEGVSRDAEASYELVRELDADNGVTWLGRSPANNTWAIAVPEALADEEGLATFADLARYLNEGGEFRLVASQEFVDREDALPAFEETYGFMVEPDQLVILAGGDTTQTLTAAAQGTDGANAGMAYGTDGAVAALGLVALTDPEGAVAIYQPAPIVRTEVFEQYPELAELLDPVFAGLDEATLSRLNAQVQVEGENPTDVARDYLEAEGFLN
ncbi:MAG: ABC transporter substrate-binding protein [Deinococcota bacterium]|jgi:osmoprotectant transport system substrate-binding protein|nr:ABC transporter substrate-binding protein [Deinococcota bacterium]